MTQCDAAMRQLSTFDRVLAPKERGEIMRWIDTPVECAACGATYREIDNLGAWRCVQELVLRDRHGRTAVFYLRADHRPWNETVYAPTARPLRTYEPWSGRRTDLVRSTVMLAALRKHLSPATIRAVDADDLGGLGLAGLVVRLGELRAVRRYDHESELALVQLAHHGIAPEHGPAGCAYFKGAIRERIQARAY